MLQFDATLSIWGPNDEASIPGTVHRGRITMTREPDNIVLRWSDGLVRIPNSGSTVALRNLKTANCRARTVRVVGETGCRLQLVMAVTETRDHGKGVYAFIKRERGDDGNHDGNDESTTTI